MTRKHERTGNFTGDVPERGDSGGPMEHISYRTLRTACTALINEVKSTEAKIKGLSDNYELLMNFIENTMPIEKPSIRTRTGRLVRVCIDIHREVINRKQFAERMLATIESAYTHAKFEHGKTTSVKGGWYRNHEGDWVIKAH
jgi:hypothetical protein